jgi:MFS family permease
LVGAQFLSETGDGVVMVALPLYVLAETGSATAMSLAFTASMAGGAVLAVVGGVCADRFDRQTVLKLSFLARAALLVALGVSARMLGQMDNPSFDALVTAQATDDDMQQVLSVRRFIQSVSIVIGPGIGALLVWLIGEKPTLLAAAVAFVLAACIHLWIGGIDTGHAERRAGHEAANWREFGVGIAIVARTPFVRRLCGYWMIQTAAIAIAMASAAVWFEQTLESGDYWYGLSIAGYGVGSALATLAFGGHRFTWSLPQVLRTAAPVYALACGIGVAAHVPWLMLAGWTLWGLTFGPEIVRAEPEFVARIDTANLGRAYAGIGVAITAGSALGYAVAGPLIDGAGPRVSTLVAATILLGSGALWVMPGRATAPAVAGAVMESTG